jgi:hypothetical protein
MFAVIEGWARPMKLGGRGLVVTCMLAIGAVMPIARAALVLSGPPWKPDIGHSLYEVSAGASANYLADIRRDSLLGQLLKDPPIGPSR